MPRPTHAAIDLAAFRENFRRACALSPASRTLPVVKANAYGYPRHAPNGTPVLIKGRRAPLAGHVSMDMITVDVTDLPDVNPGDEVVLWGDGLGVNEVARHAGTIGYELLAGMPHRTPREYQPI